MFLPCFIYVLFLHWLRSANCATFYMDDGNQQSLPFSVGGQRMNHFRAQMLNLMGLKKPTGDMKVGDKFASRFMSTLYKEISQSESELRFNPNFRFFDNEESAQPNFDYQKIQADSHASDTIISFVPKMIRRVRDAPQLFELIFEFSAAEFQNLWLIGVELYFILEGDGADGFPLRSSDVIIKGVEDSKSYHINFDDFSSSGHYTFFSLNISRLLGFWPTTFAHPTVERKLWIEFLNVNGSEGSAAMPPKLHCFGVGFFVEGEREVMKRVRRSFATAGAAAFEVEEKWDEDEEDADGEANDDRSQASHNAESADSKSASRRPSETTTTTSESSAPTHSKKAEVSEANDESSQKVSDAFAAGLMADEEISSTSTASNSGRENTNGTENGDSKASNFSSGGMSSKAGETKAAESFIRAASPKFGVSSGFRSLTGSRRCRVRSLYVDFKDLGWDGWVIAPTGYQADYCDGDCSFPLDVSVNPTNHAIVQALVHLFDEKRALPAKCAPIAMRAQSLLFFNNEKNVVMRRYQNMRVKQCGCR